jgi:hypothetical protein
VKKRILVWLGILLALVIAAGFALPTDFAVERRLVINAPPNIINAYLESPKRWKDWSAWNPRLDPTLVYTYSGPERGQDAKHAWTSENSGNGWMKITRSSPKTGINYRVQMEGQAHLYRGNILLQRPPEGQSGTLVSWTMLGSTEGNFFMRYLALKFDEWMGADFEIGLQQLQILAEKDAIAALETEKQAALNTGTSSVTTSSTSSATASSTRTSSSAP